MNPLSVLAVDDDFITLEHIEFALKSGYIVHKTKTVEQALEIIRRIEINIVLLDIDLGCGFKDGLQGLREIKKVDEAISIVMLTSTKSMDIVKQAIALGAADYIYKPIEGDDLIFLMNKIEIRKRLENEKLVLKSRLDSYEADHEILGASPAIKSMLEKIDCLDNHDVNILITGESGTGKELVAKRLHARKGCSSRPFVPINCAAIPPNLLESILFGYEKSAYTGATKSSPGKFELADGGDIFLDEISCLNFELQAKLLRVIQEREVERIGAMHPKKVSFRVISASNRNLLEMIKQGKFREDLYYRINAVEIKVPPLRERKEDIPLLAEAFIKKTCGIGLTKKLDPSALKILVGYDWPGNVRQLEHVITNAIVFSKGDVIYSHDIPSQLKRNTDDFDNDLSKTMEEFEKKLICEAIDKSSSIREAAKFLKLKPTTLYSKLEKYKDQQ